MDHCVRGSDSHAHPGKACGQLPPNGASREGGDEVAATPGLTPIPGTNALFSLWLRGVMARAADRDQVDSL